ncbi:MAG: sugar phosphate isomerase/epimerase [Verrucomicrobia bacterium]|nr:sugar phosphate isomerase/epimerase [Verrucomicrobiota bacterium]
MKLSFSTLGCPNWSLEQIVRRAGQYGYEGVAFRGLGGELDLTKAPEFLSTMRANTRRRLKEAGLATSMVMTSAAMMIADPERLKATLQLAQSHIDIAADLECPYIRVFGGQIPQGVSHAAAVRWAGDRLLRLGDYARQRGVKVLIESHDDWVVTSLLRRAVEAADHPSVGVLWDVHHPVRIAGESLAQSWTNIGPWVRCVDIKDSITDFESKLGYRYVQIGDGEIPWKGALQILKAARFDGWLTFEWEKLWHPTLADPSVAFPEFIARIRALEDEIGSASING